MQTTIDLASHRLDAWITSFATQRLAALRARQPEGLFIGAYGWVESLHQRGLGTPLQTLPPDEPEPLFAQPGDTGFIHAPSMTQAATAALLETTSLPAESIAANNVVDGLRLFETWRTDRASLPVTRCWRASSMRSARRSTR